MTEKKQISAAFPFESNFQEVLDSKMHYVDEGDKNSKHTFLLLHGNPTSCYLWRNIIPHLTPIGRVVAPDLIGMGKSGKPDIEYSHCKSFLLEGYERNGRTHVQKIS